MMTDTPTVPALVGLGPGPTTGVRLLLGRNQQLVGRAGDCEITLTEDQVGARHAVLTQCEGRIWVQDLGTPGGTFVNGRRLDGAVYLLQRGDVVVFGTVALRLTAEPSQRPGAGSPPVEPSAANPVDEESAGHRLARQRDALLGEIELLRVRARRMLSCGGAAFVFGLALFWAGASGLVTNAGQDRTSHPLGPEVLGVPYGLLGWGVSALGMVLLVAGCVLHNTATARRQRVERELPWVPSGRRHR